MYNYVKNIYKSNWTSHITRVENDGTSGNKLRRYKTFKHHFGYENYLTYMKNFNHRKYFTRLRNII